MEIGKKPEHGRLGIDPNGNWVYTPDPGFVGKDSFSILVTDPEGSTREMMFEIEIEPETIPLGNAGASDEIIPGNVSQLPQTGESSLLLIQLAGLALIAAAIALRLRKRNNA